MVRLGLLTTALLVGAVASVWAQGTAGGPELKMLEAILTGNIGLTLGLGVTILGIYRLAMGATSEGITLCIVGVLIVLTPSIYNGVRLIVDPIVRSLT